MPLDGCTRLPWELHRVRTERSVERLGIDKALVRGFTAARAVRCLRKKVPNLRSSTRLPGGKSRSDLIEDRSDNPFCILLI